MATAGFAGRQEPHERRVVIGFRIVPVDELRRRAGFARDRVAGNLRRLRRSVLDDALHDRGQRGRGVGGDRAAQRLRFHHVAPVVAIHGPEHPRLDVFAAVGDRAHGAEHLQRRHRDLVADRDVSQRAVGPLLRFPHDAGALAREVGRHRVAESVSLDEAAQPLGSDLESDLHRADVAGIGDDVAEGQDAVIGGVVDVAGADVNDAGARVDHRVDRHDLFFDGRRRGHELEGGPGSYRS